LHYIMTARVLLTDLEDLEQLNCWLFVFEMVYYYQYLH
jgi:hypothetical protein